MLQYRHLAPFINQRLLFMMVFGFYSGLPLGLSGSTLQAWFTETHVSLMAIGVLSLASFPYACKFLWAPLLDRFIFAGLGRRRGWILLTQFCLALALFLLSMMHPESQLQMIACLVLLITFTSATQDIAIDAYRADVLKPLERGLGSAFFIFAYRMALFVSGGLALVTAGYWGWERTYQLMAGLILLGMLATYYAPETLEAEDCSSKERSKKTVFFLEPFLDLWRRDNIVLIVLFIILYKAGAALALALMTNFLLHGLGFTLVEIGLSSKAAIIAGTISGAFVGGIFLWRLGLYASLLWFGSAQALSILLFMLLAFVGKAFPLMTLTLFIENFCGGMSTAAFMAFLMSLCHVRYSATQFAFLSAIDSLGRSISGPLAALLVTQFGWISFYGWSFIVSLPALLILMILGKRISFDAPAVSYS